MQGQFRNSFQAALLYDAPPSFSLPDTLARIRADCRSFGLHLRPGSDIDNVAILLGRDELQLKLELVNRLANPKLFQSAMGSAWNLMAVPDVPERILRHRCYALITIGHGSDSAAYARDLPQALRSSASGQSHPLFLLRIRVLQTAIRALSVQVIPSFAHWTLNDLFIASDKLLPFCSADPIGFPIVHPFIFYGPYVVGQPPATGFLTLGAANCIGYEFMVDATPVPWSEQYESVIALLRLATMDNGYLIPDGDTFGRQDGNFSYRVRHLAAGVDGVRQARIRLTLLFSKSHGYRSAEYEPRQTIPGGVEGAERVIGTAKPDARQAVHRMRETQAMVEGVGSRLVVSVPKSSPPPARPPGGGKIVPFGRRGA